MNDSRDFQDAESVRSGNSHVTSRLVSFPPHPIPGEMLSRSIGMPSRKDGPPSIWDTHGISGNVSANPDASSSAPYPQELNPCSSGRAEPIHSSTGRSVRNKHQFRIRDASPNRQPKIHSSLVREILQRTTELTNNDCRSRIFISTNSPATFACFKTRFKTEVCTCSQFPTEAMLWIEEVELVDSVDDLKSSRSITGTHRPDFEVLDARIASALNRIIHNSHFKRRVSLEEQKAQKEDRFFRGRQIAFLIYDHFRVTGSQ